MTSLSDAAQALLGEPLSPQQVAAFERYAAELVEWNRRFNLTTITEPAAIQTRHFLDSLSCWLGLRKAPPASLIDVGAGAGFPGVPLKILRPDLSLTLLESTAKKASFLEHIVQVLGLADVTVLAQRAEDAGQSPAHRERYDWAVARAVAPLPVLAEYLLPFVKVGGRMLAQKARGAQDEVAAASGALAKLGGEFEELISVQVPGLDEERWLVVIRKVAATPPAYPRRAGMPTKRPL
jgi:16S rRNA (guanine527-N7)-methyltransferase